MLHSFCAGIPSVGNQGEEWLTLRMAQKVVPFSGNTLRKWANLNKVKVLRSPAGRLWSKTSLLAMLGAQSENIVEEESNSLNEIGVAVCLRVSSKSQNVATTENGESSLQQQENRMRDVLANDERFKGKRLNVTFYKRVASGMDVDHPILLNMVRDILSKKYRYLLVQDKSRLSRCAHGLLEYLCELGQCEVIYIMNEKEIKSQQQEMVDDILMYLASAVNKQSSYKAKLILQVKVETEVIKRIIKMHLDLHSNRDIARILEKEGIRGEDNRPITKSVIARILKDHKRLIPEMVESNKSAHYQTETTNTFILFCNSRLRAASPECSLSFKAIKQAYREWALKELGEAPEGCDRRIAQLIQKQFPSVQLGYTSAKMRIFRGLSLLASAD